jgi:hypothetical protein
MVNAAPMNADCGRYCGKACCQPDEDNQGGMYLFPGEEELITFQAWAHISEKIMPVSGRHIKLLTCYAPCQREHRPLACMIFPLTPIIINNQPNVRIDARSLNFCPIARKGAIGLRKTFVEVARAAIELIAADPAGRSFIRDWQMEEAAFVSAVCTLNKSISQR